MTDGEAYPKIAAAMAAIADMRAEQPDLDWVAAEAGMSPAHFQRVFKRWVGLSPKKFLQHLTLDYAKARLAESQSVLDAALDSGLSGPGRLHDLFVVHEAMTPGDYKRRGEGLAMRWGWAPSPFGQALLFMTDRGLAGLAFAEPGAAREQADVLANMQGRWPAADFVEDEDAAKAMATSIFQKAGVAAPLPLCLIGTPFQIKVWRALLEIPGGHLATYGDVARLTGQPKAARAVGAAIGRNPISWIIPCHRAILSNGYVRNYEWGIPRKLAMIGWEAAQRDATHPAHAAA
jgi:AraC family transcriptional regulator of adaptative response/methylated-DNA-[protein]-cysteine methyltransferase